MAPTFHSKVGQGPAGWGQIFCSCQARRAACSPLRRHCKDGTRALVFDPLDFIARLAALVPRPRAHLLTWHGLLAPAAEGRDWIVPGVGRSARREVFQSLAGEALRPQRSKWAELLKRLFVH